MNTQDIQKGKIAYTGKAKSVYNTNRQNILIQHFRDDITAGNGERHSAIPGKGRANSLVSSTIFSILEQKKLNTHYIGLLSETEQVIKAAKIIPIEAVIRNAASGSFVKRYGVQGGYKFPFPIFEMFYKDDSLGDPLINEDQAIVLGAVPNRETLATIRDLSIKINEILYSAFQESGLELIDFKLEFGYDQQQNVILADEISPDSCRIRDIRTGENYDKDIFRNNSERDLVAGYLEVLQRLHQHCNKRGIPIPSTEAAN